MSTGLNSRNYQPKQIWFNSAAELLLCAKIIDVVNLNKVVRSLVQIVSLLRGRNNEEETQCRILVIALEKLFMSEEGQP